MTIRRVAATYESRETRFLIMLREGFRLDLHAARRAQQLETVHFCVDQIELVERTLLERCSARP